MCRCITAALSDARRPSIVLSYPIPLLLFLRIVLRQMKVDANGSRIRGSSPSSNLSLSHPAQICESHRIRVAESFATIESAVPRNKPA